jgi:hypothetical protein
MSMSQYLFIAILCAKMYRVNKALMLIKILRTLFVFEFTAFIIPVIAKN